MLENPLRVSSRFIHVKCFLVQEQKKKNLDYFEMLIMYLIMAYIKYPDIIEI